MKDCEIIKNRATKIKRSLRHTVMWRKQVVENIHKYNKKLSYKCTHIKLYQKGALGFQQISNCPEPGRFARHTKWDHVWMCGVKVKVGDQFEGEDMKHTGPSRSCPCSHSAPGIRKEGKWRAYFRTDTVLSTSQTLLACTTTLSSLSWSGGITIITPTSQVRNYKELLS